MDDQFYFMALGGLGVSLAGFAGLIAALDRRPAHGSPVTAWRIRNIVLQGFSVTFTGFGTVALYSVTRSNLMLTVRVASIGVALFAMLLLWREHQPGPAWPSDTNRRVSIAAVTALSVAGAANAIYAGLGALEFLLLWMLLGAASIFLNTVRDLARGDAVP